MPWQPLPRIAFAVATYPFTASHPADLPLELGDELYIIEQGGKDAQWLRGYLVAPPSLLAGLTSQKGQTLEARVFSGVFPRSCVEVREVLGEGEEGEDGEAEGSQRRSDTPLSSPRSGQTKRPRNGKLNGKAKSRKSKSLLSGISPETSLPLRDPNAPQPPAPVPMLKIGDETPTSISEPLVDEIASCLREWHSRNLHELLLSRQYPSLEKMSTLTNTLDLARRQLLHNVLTAHELRSLREKTVWDLVRGNKLFNGEVIVRDPEDTGRILTGDDSAVEITKLQSIMTLLGERPVQQVTDTLTLHHLLVDVKAFVGSSSESTTLEFFLASRAPGATTRAWSESYIVEVPPGGSLTDIAKAGQMRTFFTDLAAGDIGDLSSAENEMYLVVKIRSSQQIAVGKPGSRGRVVSRDGGSVRGDKDKPPSTSATSKTGRRSLMWGQKSQRTPARRRLNSLTESHTSEESQDHPPGTAGSRGTARNEPRQSTIISRTITRTLGIGVLQLNAIMKQDEEIEQVMTVWSPSLEAGATTQADKFQEIIEDLMPSRWNSYEKSTRAERLQVRLKAFEGPDADILIKATPTLLSGVLKTSKMGFSGAPTKPRSDIYVTMGEAFLPKQVLLSRSIGAATPLTNNVAGSNLQATVEVRRASGERIEDCIYSSSNSEAESTWESTATERGAPWNQTLRLALEPNEVAGAHIVMTLAEMPHQPFSICYMPLWDQAAFIRDGQHPLLLYRYDDTTANPRPTAVGKSGYLALAWSAKSKDDMSKDEAVTGPLATLNLQTYLCSTKFSQDKVLLGLIRWKDQPAEDIPELLKRLVFVSEIEIVKLLSEVFDAIFSLLVEQAGNDEYEDLIFSALVTVLGIVHDRRFNLEPLVDHYAENRFNYPFATPCLVRSFTRLLAKPSDPETSRNLRATFKVVRHILRFITHARDQQKVKEAGIGLTTSSPGFTRHLRAIFKALDGLMRNTAPILVGSQTLAVQHFHTWLPELTGLLTTEEILHIAIDFMDSCSLVKGKLILYKLVLIINYSRLDLFSQQEQKKALAANTARWIAPHWGKTTEVSDQYRDQVRLCCSILATQVPALGPEIPDHVSKVIDSYLALQAAPKTPKSRLSLLFPQAYPFQSKPIFGTVQFDEAIIELSAILSAISTLPAGMQLELATEDMTTLLEDVLHAQLSILDCEAFPPDWLSIRIYHHKSTMKTLEFLASILLETFLPDPDDAENYNTELWKIFLTALLKLVGSDALALETFPEQKRRAVWKIGGDVREQGAELLRRTWEAIGWETSPEERQKYGLAKMGGYQVQYVPTLVGPIVELCLSVHEGLRRVAVEVLQSMIVSEWTLSEDLSVIQTEMIDCLDRLFKSKPLTESILQKLFINELLELFEPLSRADDDPLYASLKDVVSTIDEFLDLLVAVHSHDGAGEASHMIHRLRLMEFLRDMQKEEIFIRYVSQLAELQADARNFTEAGLALRLHADLYEWDPAKAVGPLNDPSFPAQTAFERKERIYFDIIKYFEDGEAWQAALETYEELLDQYKENVFDFPKLARTQRAIATIYETISKSDKVVPKYFKVTYKGMGFPTSLRDKEFVFEGSPTERTSAFTDRMQEQHPSAQIVTSGDVNDVEGQFIQISQLSPHRDLEHAVFQRSKVPQIVRDYLLTRHPQVFSITSKRNTSGPVHEHSAEKIIYTTNGAFPTILRRSEIVSSERVALNAQQTALERVIRKTQEMMVVERRVVVDGEESVLPLLIEALNISADPQSETSVAKYRELLPTLIEDEEVQEVELSPLENALKVALIDHAIMIKRCLSFFSKSLMVPVAYQGQVDELAQSIYSACWSLVIHANKAVDFEITFTPELSSFSFPQSRPNAPRSLSSGPSWASPPPTSPYHGDSTAMTLATIPHVSTNGTVDTSILNISPDTKRTSLLPNQGGKARLSLFRKQNNTLNSDTPQLNGKGTPKRSRTTITTSQPEEQHNPSRSQDLKKSLTNGSKSLSIFSAHSNAISTALTNTHTAAPQVEISDVDAQTDVDEGDDKEWVTQSDLSQAHTDGRTLTESSLASAANSHSHHRLGNASSGTMSKGRASHRRSSSTQRTGPSAAGGGAGGGGRSLRRPDTGSTLGQNGDGREAREENKGVVAKGIGSVRKRLSASVLKGLGKKSSRDPGAGGALGGSVVVEE